MEEKKETQKAAGLPPDSSEKPHMISDGTKKDGPAASFPSRETMEMLPDKSSLGASDIPQRGSAASSSPEPDSGLSEELDFIRESMKALSQEHDSIMGKLEGLRESLGRTAAVKKAKPAAKGVSAELEKRPGDPKDGTGKVAQ